MYPIQTLQQHISKLGLQDHIITKIGTVVMSDFKSFINLKTPIVE